MNFRCSASLPYQFQAPGAGSSWISLRPGVALARMGTNIPGSGFRLHGKSRTQGSRICTAQLKSEGQSFIDDLAFSTLFHFLQL